MKRTFALINQNCRTAAGLIALQCDRPLSLLERTGLAIHLFICRSCRRYRSQLRAVDQLTVSTAAPVAGPPTAMPEKTRQRIATRIEGRPIEQRLRDGWSQE